VLSPTDVPATSSDRSLLAIGVGSNPKASGGQATRIGPTARQPPADFSRAGRCAPRKTPLRGVSEGQ
jgi:hypothetical protein